eukprot:TRINITY_DN61017_c0_g1_i1.p1 TRINITY_DN61017_c0_g1~~TRINITY_DN61017_c0_g1_i1.p1  ORF type:complete len:216 (+),score=73.80 TRINITY_DN61017_c0_g1_i1:40-687(+)
MRCLCVFFFQAEDGIRDAQESRGLGDVYKRQEQTEARERLLVVEREHEMAKRHEASIKYSIRNGQRNVSGAEHALNQVSAAARLVQQARQALNDKAERVGRVAADRDSFAGPAQKESIAKSRARNDELTQLKSSLEMKLKASVLTKTQQVRDEEARALDQKQRLAQAAQVSLAADRELRTKQETLEQQVTTKKAEAGSKAARSAARESGAKAALQ